MNEHQKPYVSPYGTRVINIHDADACREAQRLGLYVRVDRRMPLGNPFRIGPDGDREDVIRKHAEWIKTQPHLLARLPDLAGKHLACHCHPKPCHADTLARMADEAHAAREQACRQRGICSSPDCERPVDGYCTTHGAGTKLCFLHLIGHNVQHKDGSICRFHMLIDPPEGWRSSQEEGQR